MFVYRAKVIGMTESGTCKVQVFAATGNSEITAEVCSQKGLYTFYKKDEIVYVAWLGEEDWVVLGSPNPSLNTEIDKISVKSLFAEEGTLYGDVLLSQKMPDKDNPLESGSVSVKNVVAAYKEISSLRNEILSLKSKIGTLEKLLVVGGITT